MGPCHPPFRTMLTIGLLANAPLHQILKMENLVLKVLQFDMGAVTAYSFAERFLKAANANEKTRHLTQYLMELTLQDGERYLKYKPSVAAASCIVVALHTLGMPVWVRVQRGRRCGCAVGGKGLDRFD